LVAKTKPFQPLDNVLSFSHLTLYNTTFARFAPAFKNRAKVTNLLTASPLDMGLLTPKVPEWHPAPKPLRYLKTKLEQDVGPLWGDHGGLVDLALGYSLRCAATVGGPETNVPTVVGLSNLKEVHEVVKVWRDVSGGVDHGRRKVEGMTTKSFTDAGWMNWTWGDQVL
jgi:D-arabinose 1-dehydrogenase